MSFLPFGASAGIFTALLGAGAVTLIGISVYRTVAPVDVKGAFEFFSGCWSCQMFLDVMGSMSEILPRAYNGLGRVIVPFMIGVTAIWIAWQLFKSFTEKTGNLDVWSLSDTFVTHFVKIIVVSIVLLAPFPRMITDVIIEPVFNVGLYVVRNVDLILTDNKDEGFNMCMIETAMADRVTAHEQTASSGAFSPKFRHSLACQVAKVHELTGIGMTAGWTMMNMAFHADYMHKILHSVPIFPNVPMFLAGLLILILFLGALLPIPVYFLEVFVKLTMDLLLLPLTFLGWVFKGWNIFPQGAQNKNLRAIVDDIINAAAGITLTCLFVTFSVSFLDTIFGQMSGVGTLSSALSGEINGVSGRGLSELLIEGLMMRNDSLITILVMGVFIAMFMTSIPALVKSLFKVSVSSEYYNTLKKDVKTVSDNIKKIWQNAQK